MLLADDGEVARGPSLQCFMWFAGMSRRARPHVGVAASRGGVGGARRRVTRSGAEADESRCRGDEMPSNGGGSRPRHSASMNDADVDDAASSGIALVGAPVHRAGRVVCCGSSRA